MSFEEPNDPRSSEISNSQIQQTELATYEERTPGHFMCFFWSDSYPILKRPGVNALRNAFETDINPITQTTSGGGLGRIPDETGLV